MDSLDRSRVAGLILCGGRSRRMGRDKAFLAIGGEMLLARVARTLQVEAAEVVLAAGPPERAFEMGRRTGLRAVADAVTDAGPIAGVIAGLNALASADVVLVAACDLPGVTSSFFAELARSLAASPQADAVIPETEGGVEPCLAAYRPRAARLLEREAAAGRLGLAEASGALCVVPLRIPSGDPRRTCFRNVNTPADLAAAQAP